MEIFHVTEVIFLVEFFSWGRFCFEHFYVRYLENKEKPSECDCHHSAQTEKYAGVEIDSIKGIDISRKHGDDVLETRRISFLSVVIEFPISY